MQMRPPSRESFRMVRENRLQDLEYALSYQTIDVHEIDSYYNNLAICAADTGSLEALQLLVSYGVDVNGQNFFGDTALHVAMRNDSEEIADWLLDVANADSSIQNTEGRTCYYYAI